MVDNKDLKKKVSDFIGTFSMGLEKAAHKTIDQTGKFTTSVKESLKEGFEEFSGGVQDFIEMIRQVDPTTLSPGDLVLSKTDIKNDKGTVLHAAGEVFEFSEEIITYLGKTPLFTPDMKTAVKFARIDELKRISKVIPNNTLITVPIYVLNRINEINNPKKVEEPVHA